MLKVLNKLNKLTHHNFEQVDLVLFAVIITFDDFDERQLRVAPLDH